VVDVGAKEEERERVFAGLDNNKLRLTAAVLHKGKVWCTKVLGKFGCLFFVTE